MYEEREKTLTYRPLIEEARAKMLAYMTEEQIWDHAQRVDVTGASTNTLIELWLWHQAIAESVETELELRFEEGWI